ncbi:MAG: hypothetical protein LIP77_09655 [Planctomycetes bacterium]|nr:hypothetical protein [Planctomycetota bacterium]
MDLLISIIMELLGLDVNKKATPRRQTRPTDSPEAEPRPVSFEDLVRQVIGVPEGEERAPSPPPPEPMTSPALSPVTRQTASLERPVPPRTYRPNTAASKRQRTADGQLAMSTASPEPASSGRGLSPVAGRLRNPAAARDAFIAAEIFGRPVGDR